MEFHILGRLAVYHQGYSLDLGTPKQRAVLTALLFDANEIVPSDRLIRSVWTEPPEAARSNLRAYVTGLRRGLRVPSERRSRLHTARAGGYRLSVFPHELDLDQFEDLALQADRDTRQGLLEPAAGKLTSALQLWRGPALEGLLRYGPVLQTKAIVLEEQRLATVERWSRLKLHLRQPEPVLPELRALVKEHPLREPLWGLLMLALCESGRPSEALSAYVELRALLAHELGADPSEELQRLHEAILRDDDLTAHLTFVDAPSDQNQAGLPGGPPVAIPTTAQVTKPQQLPAGASGFTGRQVELAEVLSLLRGSGDRTGSKVVKIDGGAGVGKSAFAVRVAHAASSMFPDGQFYVDLQGTSGGLAPRNAADVLGQFLRGLGVHPADVPHDVAEAAALFRSLTAQGSFLFVLDNAGSLEQVRPLIPGSSGSAALVISRQHLMGLEEAARFPLGLLPTTDAVALLGSLCGVSRVLADPIAATRLAVLCGQLPLALRIVGARLASTPGWSLGAFADRLEAAQSLLDELASADLAIRPSLELTYNSLAEPARQAFRRLGLLRTRDFSSWTVAALVDTSIAQAEQLLEELLRVHFLESSGSAERRFHMHDLVRLYAQEQALTEPEHTRTAAVRRLVGACLSLTERANLRLSADFLGISKYRVARWSPPREELERLTARPQAWLDQEHALLLAAVEDGLDTGAGRLAGCLAASLSAHLRTGGHLLDWRRLQTRALQTAIDANDMFTAAKLHRELAELDTLCDRYPDAIRHFEAAYAVCEGRDRWYEAACSAGLGYLHRLLGSYDLALKYYHVAGQLALDTGNVNGVIYAINGMGVVLLECDELPAAASRFDECLRLSRQVGYLPGEAQGLRCLGYVARRRGNLAQSGRYFLAAKEISERTGDRLESAHAACWLGEIRVREGRPFEGRRLLAESLWAERKYGNAWGEAAAMLGLAHAQLAASRPALALRRAQAAAQIWTRLGSPYWLATALDIVADAEEALGDQAAAHASRSGAAQIRSRLRTLQPFEVATAAAALRIEDSIEVPSHGPTADQPGQPRAASG
ncbi:AfsR/SARP family transcriptional regulator [Flindersiella endophytica]